jgi:hypothetical protein
MQTDRKQPSTKPARMLPRAMMLALTLTLTRLLTGCETHPPTVHEIDSNREVKTVHKDVPFTPDVDGKFVPEARFDEMLDVYIRASTTTK